jgi:hypothetical protein
LHGIGLVIGGEFLDAIVDILTDKVALFHPSRFAVGGANFYEVAIMVENFDAVSVLDDPGFFVDGGNVIAQVGLNSGDVGDFKNASSATMTTDEEQSAADFWGRTSQGNFNYSATA